MKAIKVKHKGKAALHNVSFNIHQHYDIGFTILNDTGYYYWKRNDYYGFYDKDSKL